MSRHYTEDGPEDTGAHVGGVAPSGHNGSLSLYRPQPVEFCKPSAAQREAMAAVRLRLLVRAKASALQQLRG